MSEDFKLESPRAVEITDVERGRFLQALDDSSLDVSDWEAEFLDTNLGHKSFSVPQRTAIDKMISKYRGLLPW